MSEREAFRYMQKLSMNLGEKMSEVASLILRNEL
ncbi:ANTAR domain-containing protein [Clostridium sp. DSM 1985]|nr:ANTAR domain-containing protein [Clostridium sp. DSM 1985]